jgi:ABC-2 type transport system permease protein
VRVDWGPLLAAYLGTLSLGAALLAVGLLASSLARDPLVAAVLGVVGILMLFMIGFLLYAVPDPELRRRMLVYSWVDQMRDFSRGILDSRHVIYNASIAIALVAASARRIELERWR